MSQMDEIWNNDEIRNPEAEPLPFIDYNLIQRIISIPASRLYTQELDSFTSLLEARKLYYDAHNIFWLVYNGLQDAKGYEVWQMAEMKKLDNMNKDQDAELWEKLKFLKNNIRKNQIAIISRLEQVRLRWQKCDEATAEFGRKKTEFAATNWPVFKQASEKPEVKAILTSSSVTAASAAAKAEEAVLPEPSTFDYGELDLAYSPLSPPTLTSSPNPPTLMLTPPHDLDSKMNIESGTVVAESHEEDPMKMEVNEEVSGKAEGRRTTTTTTTLRSSLYGDNSMKTTPKTAAAAAVAVSKDASKRKRKRKRDGEGKDQHENATNNPPPPPPPKPRVNFFGESIISARYAWLE